MSQEIEVAVDLIVVGCGAMGSAALYHAAKGGQRALGIDRFHPPHNLGSSHGHTRVIRQAYFEHSDYVPLILEAYHLWHQLEVSSRQSLLVETGLLEVGPPDGTIIPGVMSSAKEHDLPIELLDRKSAQQRFPAFRVPAGCEAIFEPRAGYLFVDRCIQAHLAGARASGASLACNETVQAWEATPRTIIVTTDKRRYTCQRLIFSQGAWSNQLELGSSPKFQILRKHLHWFRTPDARLTQAAKCPMFFYEINEAYFYGFPVIDEHGFKIAEHSGGEAILDPSSLDRSVDRGDLARVSAFLRDNVDSGFQHSGHEVCMYTMSPDGHFVLDFHPSDPRVVVACGFSGHGFKFASVIGKLAVDMVTKVEQPEAARFLSLARFRNV